jgi:hypothetical protein
MTGQERVYLGIRRRYGLVLVIRRGTVFGLPGRRVNGLTAGQTARALSGELLPARLADGEFELRGVRGTMIGGVPGSALLFVTDGLFEELHPGLRDGDYVWSRARRPSVPLDPVSAHFVHSMFHLAVPLYEDLADTSAARSTSERRRWISTRRYQMRTQVPLRSRSAYPWKY